MIFDGEPSTVIHSVMHLPKDEYVSVTLTFELMTLKKLISSWPHCGTYFASFVSNPFSD